MQSDQRSRELRLVPGVSIGPWTLGTSRTAILKALRAEYPMAKIWCRDGEKGDLVVTLGDWAVNFDFDADDRLAFIEAFVPTIVVFNDLQLTGATVQAVHAALGRPVVAGELASVNFPELRVGLFTDENPTPTSVTIGVSTYAHDYDDGATRDEFDITLPSE